MAPLDRFVRRAVRRHGRPSSVGRQSSRGHKIEEPVAQHAAESNKYTDSPRPDAEGTREDSRLEGSQFSRALELGDYVAFVKRRWRWIALGLVLGLLAGAAYLQLAPKTYTSTAKVLVYSTTSDTETENGVTSDGVNLDTEAQIVRSVDVAEVAAETLDSGSDPVDLASKVSVTVPPNTTVLEIDFAGSSPEGAQAGASAFAEAYLDNRAAIAQDAIDTDIDTLRSRMDDLTSELTRVTRQLSDADGSNERAVLRTRRNQLTGELDTLNSTLGPLESSVQNPGRVIVGAQTPESATSPLPYLVIVSSALLGFLGALAVAVLREKFDRRPHTVHDLERVYGLPVMAEVRVRTTVTGLAEAPVAQVRALYHAMIASYAGSTRSVLVCDPSDQSSAHAIGTTLAALAAQSGTSTALVGRTASDDSRLSSQQRDLDRRGALTREDFASLGLTESGELRHRQIRPVLDDLESAYDLSVLELPTGDSSFDLPLIGRQVDLVLIVIELDHTSRPQMEAIVDDIQKVGATEVAGVAVRRAGKRRRFGRNETEPVEPEATQSEEILTAGADHAPARQETVDDVARGDASFDEEGAGSEVDVDAGDTDADADAPELDDVYDPPGFSDDGVDDEPDEKRPWFARHGV